MANHILNTIVNNFVGDGDGLFRVAGMATLISSAAAVCEIASATIPATNVFAFILIQESPFVT